MKSATVIVLALILGGCSILPTAEPQPAEPDTLQGWIDLGLVTQQEVGRFHVEWMDAAYKLVTCVDYLGQVYEWYASGPIPDAMMADLLTIQSAITCHAGSAGMRDLLLPGPAQGASPLNELHLRGLLASANVEHAVWIMDTQDLDQADWRFEFGLTRLHAEFAIEDALVVARDVMGWWQ